MKSPPWAYQLNSILESTNWGLIICNKKSILANDMLNRVGEKIKARAKFKSLINKPQISSLVEIIGGGLKVFDNEGLIEYGYIV